MGKPTRGEAMGTPQGGLSTEIDRSFPLDPRAPGDARRSLAPLGGLMPPEALIDLAVVVSEMVTNSVQHSGRSDRHVDVSIRAGPDAVRADLRRGLAFHPKDIRVSCSARP